jgi:hypothetical protein
VSFRDEKEEKNLFFYLRDQNISIFSTTVKAVASAYELFQFSNQTEVVKDLIAFYNDEWSVIEKLAMDAVETDYTKKKEVQKELIADERTNRIAVPQIISLIAKQIKDQDLEDIMRFLVTQSCLDQNQEVREAS